MIDFLPGIMRIEPGGRDDYHRLARFHYRSGPPATFCLIRRAVYRPANEPTPILAGVGVLSWPTLRCHARERCFALAGMDSAIRAVWLRDHLRTISRIIVHPRFRGIGLATAMIRRLCDDCPVMYVEAMAAMGAIHPMFARAEMTKVSERYYVRLRLGGPRMRNSE